LSALCISRDLFPKSIDHVNGSRAAQKPCTNLKDRFNLFAYYEMSLVLRVDAASRKPCDTQTNDLTRSQRQQRDGE
jgi:hypothetical protein